MSALSPIVAAFKESAEINPETSAMSRTYFWNVPSADYKAQKQQG